MHSKKCPFCTGSFTDSAALIKHLPTHTGAKITIKKRDFELPNVGFTQRKMTKAQEASSTEGSSSGQLTLTVDDSKLFNCRNCSYSSKFRRLLQVQLHKGKCQPFKCSKCSRSFTSYRNLRIHEGLMHVGFKSPNIFTVNPIRKCKR